jgi:DNA-directed RNA polymerase subunit RPC12/RpoP
MFNICPQCGQYHADKEIDLQGSYAVCPECGAKQLFRQLPLLLVCGPSGGGKTAVLRRLLGQIESAILLEGDLLWRTEFNRPEDNYRDFFETWLRMAKNINQAGRPTVLFNAGAIPPNIEPCVERRYFSASSYLTLVCDDEVLAARLRARPSWRGSGGAKFLIEQLQFNRWLKENHASTMPPMNLLDTTDGDEATAAMAVAGWILEHV